MLEWLIGAGGMIAAALLWGRERRGRPRVTQALPPSALNERLRPLLEAIEGVQALAEEVTAADLRRCAPVRVTLWPAGATGSSAGGNPAGAEIVAGAGPGPQRFVALYEALGAVSEDDRRSVAEAGFELVRLAVALEPRGAAEAWRDELLRQLMALRRVLAQVRRRPYR